MPIFGRGPPEQLYWVRAVGGAEVRANAPDGQLVGHMKACSFFQATSVKGNAAVVKVVTAKGGEWPSECSKENSWDSGFPEPRN